MRTQQSGDFLADHSTDEAHFYGWSSDFYDFTFDKPQVPGFSVVDDNMYVNGLVNGMTSMQPMQRFMFDPSPQSSGLLHANIPLQSHSQNHYITPYQSDGFYRNPSPDRTSVSGTSSYASQNDVPSPLSYNTLPYGSPNESCQTLSPYHAIGQFGDVSYMSGSPGAMISLKEIEYAHQETEPIIEDVNTPDVEQETAVDSQQTVIKIEADCSTYREYTDSGIGNSVRDAESVQPVDFKDETDVDSDYNPNKRGNCKRKKSTPYPTRATRRRSGARKDSAVSITDCNKPGRRPRGKSQSKAGIKCEDERRPFPCPFTAYNCTSTFASKNEWKRHVSTQHIKLGYWRCDLCAPTTDPNDASVLYHNDFNRKDLFTQHLRRMHAAHGSGARHLKEHPVNEDNIGDHQIRCYLQLRSPPQQSICPFEGCDQDFVGPASWEERMEHVGRHFEKERRNGMDLLTVTGWKLDTALEKYLMDEGLIVWEHGSWRIGDGKARRAGIESSDEDS